MNEKFEIMDWNQAASYIAYKLTELATIYPITPASPMSENYENMIIKWEKNIWWKIPQIKEMQSEAWAVWTLHWALSWWVLATTFTASQWLMLMLPEMCKIAGEMLPTVIYVASRSLAFQALSIFWDHSDVMFARPTGFAIFVANNVQEVLDFALIAHSSSLKSKIPFLFFFDWFRTSHEIQKIKKISDPTLFELIDQESIKNFRDNALNSSKPKIKVWAQNPDVYFQWRERTNEHYQKLPQIVQNNFDKLYAITQRKYEIFEYIGNPKAEIIFVVMWSASETIEEYIYQTKKNIWLIKVRLFRPFFAPYFISKIPSSCKKIIVLDKTKEAWSQAEPLYMEVVFALKDNKNIKITGWRYWLGWKDFTPAMVEAIIKNNI